VAGATVRAGRARARTDARGDAALAYGPDQPPIRASAPGFSTVFAQPSFTG
jgi:hypothetical protein